MLTYILRQELTAVLMVDPVLHYYPLLACYAEPRAPVTAWKNGEGQIGGALIPCEPPGVAWIVGGSAAAIAALVAEVPPETPITLPLWAEGVVRDTAPDRILSTEAIAVCTASTFRRPAGRRDVHLQRLERVPLAEESVLVSESVRVMGCFVGDALTGYCSYRLDGQGGGSVDRLAISQDWLSADLGKTLLAGAVREILGEAERVIFIASGENQTALGIASRVGFRTCYWLRSAAAPPDAARDMEPGPG